jgi:hypothetical protein
MTPEQILSTLAIAPKSKSALTVQSRCGSDVTMTSLYTLWKIANGVSILGEQYRSHRSKLRAAGYVTSTPHPKGIKGANHKPLPVYELTLAGVEVIELLRRELEGISNRIKRNEQIPN